MSDATRIGARVLGLLMVVGGLSAIVAGALQIYSAHDVPKTITAYAADCRTTDGGGGGPGLTSYAICRLNDDRGRMVSEIVDPPGSADSDGKARPVANPSYHSVSPAWTALIVEVPVVVFGFLYSFGVVKTGRKSTIAATNSGAATAVT